MKNLFLLITTLIIQTIVFAQDTITADHIKQYTKYFEIKQDQFVGEGAEVLKLAIAESQFTLLGEYHDDAQTSLFTTALLKEAAQNGYQYFGVETGPHSAKKLMELATPSEQTITSLNNFYSHYFPKGNDIAIPFFSGKEDALFLQTAMEEGYQLFGIDQEYYSACFFLFDDMLKSTKQKINDKIIKDMYAFIKEEFRKDTLEKNYPLHQNLLQSKEIKAFCNAVSKDNETNQVIIKDLRYSWEIYANYRSNLNKNLEQRAAYMKQQFVKNYKTFQTTKELPKVILKMGAGHTQRGFTFNAIYDVGNLVHELATINGTKVANLRMDFRYFLEEDGTYTDNLDWSSDWMNEMRPLLEQGQKDKWTIIDLRPIKADWINRKIKLTKEIKNRIKWHDYIIIPPATFDIQPNYSSK